jgi:hypothetical protein
MSVGARYGHHHPNHSGKCKTLCCGLSQQMDKVLSRHYFAKRRRTALLIALTENFPIRTGWRIVHGAELKSHSGEYLTPLNWRIGNSQDLTLVTRN